MKLVNIINTINQIKKIMDDRGHITQVECYIDSLLSSVLNSPARDNWETQVQQLADAITVAHQSFDKMMLAVLADLENKRTELYPYYFDLDQQIYNETKYELYEQPRIDCLPWQDDFPDRVLNRRLIINAEEQKFVVDRVKYYNNWKFPGFIIRPGLETLHTSMVALDPLYIADTVTTLLQPAQNCFPEKYQRRLRLYTIKDDAPFIFAEWPQNQMSFGLIYNYFNFKSFDIVCKYLEQILLILRPGGSLAFTYNDCDYAMAVGLVDNTQSCFTPGRMLKQKIQDLGYEIILEYHGDSIFHWLEIKKPGKLESVRGGQSLAEIVPIRY